MRKLLEPDK